MAARSGVRSALLPFAATVSAALASTFLLLAIFSGTFLGSAKSFFLGPFSNAYMFGNMVASAIPLLVAGLGVGIAFSSSNFNLGGEGQIYAGALASVLFAIKFQIASPFLGQALSCLAGAAVGGFLGWISGTLKRRLDVDEMISSFLLSAAVGFLVDFLITGPFQDPTSNFQTTVSIPKAFRFARIDAPSSLNSGMYVAVLLAGAAKLMVSRTRAGFELSLCGANREFAKYCGVDTGAYTEAPMAISGALHGLAGALMIFGVYFKAMKGFSSGTGWAAITVSLIAGNDPLAMIPSSIFFAWLQAGATSAMLSSNVSYEIVLIIQAVILFFVTSRFAPRTLKLSRRVKSPRKSEEGV